IDKTTGKLVSHRIADKRFMVPGVIASEDEKRLVPVAADRRNRQCLSEDMIRTIAQWAQKSESHFGCAQDIEWAFRDGEFFMLQSRPITVLGLTESDVPDGKYVLFKPMYENFSGPVLPLSQDIFASRFPVLKFIHGRGYLDLDHIRPVSPFHLTDEQLANYAYLSDDDHRPRISWWRLARLGLIFYVGYLCLGVLFRRTERMPDDFMESFRTRAESVIADPAIDASATLERLFLRTRFFEPVGNMAFMVNISAGRYFVLMRIITALLNRWLPDLERDAPSLLCSGEDGILSTDMGMRIWQLARTAASNPWVRDIIAGNKPNDALPLLQDSPEAVDFNCQLAEFLDIHGHRALKEFELNSPRWEEDPAPVIGMLRNYLLADSNPDLAEQRIRDHRRKLEARIEEELGRLPFETPLRLRWRVLRTLCRRARYFIKLRENSRFYHIMTFYAIRKKVLATEQELLTRQKLRCQDDIFFLKWTEIEGLKTNRLDWNDVEETVRERRMEHIRLTKLVPPRTIGIEESNAPVVAHGNALRGQGASPGTFQGIARVVMDPGIDATIKPGEILVAPFTDPAWTPLFLTAHAAVVEIGSYLSHAGTIAREYGMPCVVDVADCTRRIQTGDVIMVDGTNGIVTLLELTGEPASA
ncbi:MAG: hypothetical protein HUJ31_18425, partial [Pseudomonadales bacterium]|nr:hypothetical protein [Pseudomonadales bacterium]